LAPVKNHLASLAQAAPDRSFDMPACDSCRSTDSRLFRHWNTSATEAILWTVSFEGKSYQWSLPNSNRCKSMLL
jgi:hypothetical protein